MNRKLALLNEKYEYLFFKKAYTLKKSGQPIYPLMKKRRYLVKYLISCGGNTQCIQQAYVTRIYDLQSKSRQNFSWGGIVRSGPGQQYRKVGSTREREPIQVLKMTRIFSNGYPWFIIKTKYLQGYQWGGILCDHSRPNASYCKGS